MPRKKQMPTLICLSSADYRGSIAAQNPYTDQLRSVCDVLNSTDQPELRDALRRLIERWKASGPKLDKMMQGDLGLFHNVQQACTAVWTPAADGRAYFVLSPDHLSEGVSGQLPPTAEARAFLWFQFLTLNPQCNEIGGPCARCGNYFVKNRKKVYCSKRCGYAATAVARTRARLEAEHKEKMKRAEAVIKKWNNLRSRSNLDWKQWLQIKAPDISPKFITRWVNKFELPQPKGST